jgi:hypothetical protein
MAGRGRQLFEPVTTVGPRPDPADAERCRYLRSYLFMRTMIGAAGVLLPVVLLVGDLLLTGRSPFDQPSLSAFYHSGARDLFVGTLCATAVFLVTYKVVEVNLDNTLSVVAGVAAFGVALFPTARPAGAATALTPLQARLGEQTVSAVHTGCAVVFIASLGVLSAFFALREGGRPARPTARHGARFWRAYHLACTGLIAVAVAALAVSELAGGPGWALLATEVVAVWAFGASWLAKGLELDVLLAPSTVAGAARGRRPRTVRPGPRPSTASSGTSGPIRPEGAGRDLTLR